VPWYGLCQFRDTSEQLRRYEMVYKIYKDGLKNRQRQQSTINDIDDYIMRITGAY